MKRILVVHEPKNENVEAISEIITGELKNYQWTVNFKTPSDAHSPAHFLGILVVAPENLELSQSQSLGWIKKYGKILTQKSSAFISLGSAYVEMGPSHLLVPRKKIISETLSSLGWVPRMIEIFRDQGAENEIRRLAQRFATYVNSHALHRAA